MEQGSVSGGGARHEAKQAAVPRQRLSTLSLVFFLSGASALIFGICWLRVLGIVLGSSVAGTAAVLGSFMAGLALGNALMAVYGRRIRKPARAYVAIELVIVLGSMLLVYASPHLAPLAGRLLAPYADNQALLNPGRFLIAFILLLAPSVAMGMALPLLLKLLHGKHPGFMQALGRLYGWNTIGAVAGTLAAEFVLIHFAGIKSAALAAAAFKLAAVLILVKNFDLEENAPAAGNKHTALPISGTSLVLAAPFIAGLLLLALEVVWFRCLLLLNIGSSLIFAIMLATVLAGTGLGGLLVSRFRFRARSRDRLLVYLPAVAACFVVLGFYLYNLLYMVYFSGGARYIVFIAFCLLLMFPACIASGILFPLYGDKLHEYLRDETRSVAILALVNTMGAVLGAGLAAFWLLPALGLEMSIFVLALGYLLTVVPIIAAGRGLPAFLRQLVAPSAALLIVVSIFPFGAMANMHQAYSKARFRNAKLVLVREGLNETSRYYQYERFGRPFRHRLVTDAYSAPGTDFVSLRHMKMSVYLPHILRQDIRKVLQIGYGVGSTAEAVIVLDTLRQFDVVDISADIFEHGSIIHDATGRYPLRDPRTRAHVEDGRFFLQTTGEQYDLITTSTPPPRQAGVVNLYTREYFELIRKRLGPRGLATQTLPAHAVNGLDALAIIHAFCLAFEDCSLWAGTERDFILLGSNGGIRPLSAERLARPWRSSMAGDMIDIALEKPEQLGAAFVADADFLKQLVGNVQPVTDNHPHRISPDEKGGQSFYEVYRTLFDLQRRKRLFQKSAYIKSILPPESIAATLPNFRYEDLVSRFKEGQVIYPDSRYWDELTDILDKTDFETLPLLMLNSTPREQHIIDAVGHVPDQEALLAYAKRRLAQRRYGEAARLLRQYIDARGGFDKEPVQSRLYMLARALGGNAAQFPYAADDKSSIEFRDWFLRRFGSSRRL